MSDVQDPVLREAADGVCTITLNRPDAINAITTELAHSLREALAAGAEEADVIVIRGAGGDFCAGGDFNHLQEIRDDPDAVRGLFEAFLAATSLIAELPVPVIAAVDGVAMAGGFELMQSCDIALVADDARIADNHSNHAMVPGGGGTQRLPRLAGRQRALAHILSGERLDGAAAVDWGLAYRSYPAGELHAKAAELAASLAEKDRAALARTKALVWRGLEQPLAEGLRMETESVLEHLGGESAEAGIAEFTGTATAKESR